MSTTALGTLDELPKLYRDTLSKANLVPLWPALRSFLPYGMPERKCAPTIWRYNDVRPLLLQAGDLTPIEKAERRVLILANPTLDLATARATPTIYLGLQLIKPSETAPNHRHSPSAIRLVVEGKGGFTTVEGEKLPMEKGDLILTPSGRWHEHGHSGTGPVVWLDALDLPLIYSIEASYCLEGSHQMFSNKLDRSQTTYRRSGLMPYSALERKSSKYPLKRFPWSEVRENLLAVAANCARNETAHLAYVNPETGDECLPTLGVSALALRPAETFKPRRRSASSVFHIIEGSGDAVVDDAEMAWGEADTIAVPTHANIQIRNNSSEVAFLLMVDDAPMQRKLGFYEQF
jgi:gentisate 1,2-dioxygenase